MPLDPALIIPQAQAFYENIRFVGELPESQRDEVLSQVVFDLTAIASCCGYADASLTPAERLTIAIFLRYPFLSDADRRALEAWKLLDHEQREALIGQADGAIGKVSGGIPADFASVALIRRLAGERGVPVQGEKYSTLLFRFAQLVTKAHATITEEEAKVLEALWEVLVHSPSGMRAGEAEASSAGGPARPGVKPRVIPAPTNESFDQLMQELDRLVGLASVKSEIRTLANLISVQKSRSAQGLKSVQVSVHAVFAGPPGTGKTTVARLYSKLLKALGVLEKGHLVETDRAGLVAEYMGQTAAKVDGVVQQALGGVLFIDEAYALLRPNSEGDYGREAVEALLKRMEDHRDKLVVIAAGYSEEMKRFLEMNPGLSSRFSRTIDFPHYSAEELEQICGHFVRTSDYQFSEAAAIKVRELCRHMRETADRTFGNGRAMRNMFEEAVRRQANRLVSSGAGKELTREALITIESEDLVEPAGLR